MIESGEPYIRIMNKRTAYRFLPARRYLPGEVREVRRSCGMTQKGFAELMGVSVKTLEAWEQGANTPGSAAARLLDLLGDDSGLAAEVAGEPLKEYDGRAVREIRKALGLPRELFALAAGVSETACASWEQGGACRTGRHRGCCACWSGIPARSAC